MRSPAREYTEPREANYAQFDSDSGRHRYFRGFGLHGAPGIDVSTFIKDTTKAGTLIQDPDAPVSFQLAPGWTLRDGTRWGDHETTLSLEESASGITVSLYYQSPLQKPYPEGPAAALRQGMEAKVDQRQRSGLTDYHVRPESVVLRQVGDHPALSFIAEFTSGGQTRYEYMLRVLGQTVKAHFFLMGMPASEDIEALPKEIEALPKDRGVLQRLRAHRHQSAHSLNRP